MEDYNLHNLHIHINDKNVMLIDTKNHSIDYITREKFDKGNYNLKLISNRWSRRLMMVYISIGIFICTMSYSIMTYIYFKEIDYYIILISCIFLILFVLYFVKLYKIQKVIDTFIKHFNDENI
jgi:hypothetical protein